MQTKKRSLSCSMCLYASNNTAILMNYLDANGSISDSALTLTMKDCESSSTRMVQPQSSSDTQSSPERYKPSGHTQPSSLGSLQAMDEIGLRPHVGSQEASTRYSFLPSHSIAGIEIKEF